MKFRYNPCPVHGNRGHEDRTGIDFLNFPCYLNLAQECDPSVRNKWDTQRVMEIISLFVHYNWQ